MPMRTFLGFSALTEDTPVLVVANARAAVAAALDLRKSLRFMSFMVAFLSNNRPLFVLSNGTIFP
jgi:hypothetical protein